jgi:histone-arginine methyltransferase CARM1
MLQDTVRTSSYKAAVDRFSDDSIKSKDIMDLGAGSGILSFFAAQRGAKTVYAMEASKMADNIQDFCDVSKKQNQNDWLFDSLEEGQQCRIKVIKGKSTRCAVPTVCTVSNEIS